MRWRKKKVLTAFDDTIDTFLGKDYKSGNDKRGESSPN